MIILSEDCFSVLDISSLYPDGRGDSLDNEYEYHEQHGYGGMGVGLEHDYNDWNTAGNGSGQGRCASNVKYFLEGML